jgi:hypothetical protein
MSELPYVAPENAPNYYDKEKPNHLGYDPTDFLGIGYYEVSTDKLTEDNYKSEFAKLKNSMLAKVDRPNISIDCLVKYGAFSWKQDPKSMKISSEFRNFPLFQARLYGKNGKVDGGGLGLSSFDDLQQVDDYEIGIKKNLLSTPPMGDKTTIKFAIKKDIIKNLQCPPTPTPNTATITGGRRHRYGRRSRRGAVKRTKINKRKSSSRVLSKSRRCAHHRINRK